MKRFSLFLAMFFTLVSFTGCGNANVTKLKKEIHSLDAMCPINCGSSGDLISVKYLEKDNMVLLRQDLKETYKDPVSRREIATVNALGMGLIYRYYGKDSKEYVDVAFTADELTPYLNL